MNDDRYLNVLERIAVALEKLVELEKLAGAPEPVDDELEARRKDDPNPQIVVRLPDNKKATVDAVWIRHNEKLILSPKPLQGWEFTRDADNGLWFGQKLW